MNNIQLFPYAGAGVKEGVILLPGGRGAGHHTKLKGLGEEGLHLFLSSQDKTWSPMVAWWMVGIG